MRQPRMILPIILCILVSFTSAQNWTTVPAQNWSTVPKWADIQFTDFKELDFKLGYLMDNYEIASIEKCSGPHGGSVSGETEENFVYLTSQMRKLRPDSSTKILNYWATTIGGQIHCYEALNDLLANEDLWLKDDLGSVAYASRWNGDIFPQYDFRIEESRNLWIKAGLDPVIATQGGANGVFLDSVEKRKLRNCRIKTCGEDKASCCQFSAESEAAYNEGLRLAESEMADQIHALDPSYILIGNMDPMKIQFQEDLVDILDGFCFEHVMSFEATYREATEPPFINIETLENLIQLTNRLVEKEKYVFVRSFPGPVGTPLKWIDGLPTYPLPDHYPYPQPQNNLEVQQRIKDLYAFPLAVYLCAFANPGVYYTYSDQYNVRQIVPSIQNPSESQFPQDFDEYLKMNPGPPLEEPKWDGRVCSRRFTNFMITVDLEDENSATWSN